MPSSILNLCARIESHTAQQQQLAAACTFFSRWDALLQHAEQQGMGPLLHRHLESIPVERPEDVTRRLRFLHIRHQQANSRLLQCLGITLDLFARMGIPALVLKGAALCQTLYPEPGLRPMRDIDLLLARKDILHAHTFLQENGFKVSTAPFPEEHFHLPPLFKNINGLQICVELHHDLFPDCPPYYTPLPFEQLYQNRFSFEVNGVKAYTLADEEMLWHLYQHGFHAPLTYEPYKLISVADIVSLVEKKIDEIDWEKIKTVYPQLYNALPLFHCITPWNDKAAEIIPPIGKKIPARAGERFTGWPQLHLAEQKGKGVWKILQHTFFPGQWWMRIYYTPTTRRAYYWYKFVRHPKHIFWWAKLYWNIFLEANLPVASNRNGEQRSFLERIRDIKVLTVSMYKKIQRTGKTADR